MFRRILHALGWTALVATFALIVLVKAFGMHIVLYGGGEKGIHFQFSKPEEHFAALEKSRAEQKNVPSAQALLDWLSRPAS